MARTRSRSAILSTRSQSAIGNLQSAMAMRAPAVLLNVVIACALGGVVGYSIARKEGQQEIATLRQEHQAARTREQELRAQLESAFTARAAVEQQSQHVQTELAERLRRLEDLAAKLNPSPTPPVAEAPLGNGPEEKNDSAPQED
jgi:septal ring factor EnvC (AmiA/AmiB activator)